MTPDITLAHYGDESRWIGQDLVPFEVPLGVPFVNPFSDKQMQFRRQYKVTGMSLEEACTGILFGNYRPFMDIREETYSRSARTRKLTFNPFTREMEQYAGYAGELGKLSARGMAGMMVAMLGMVTWDITEEPRADPNVVSFLFKTTNRLFSGHFRIRVLAVDDGVIVDDDWTTAGGSDMRTSFLPMANLVLLTHPLGFNHIVRQMVEELKRAHAAGVPYRGEIGAPSVDQTTPGASVEERRMAGKLDVTRFVVLGESLASGLVNFSLIDIDQRESFPALVARQMGAAFPLPQLQAPGLGVPHGFPRVPVQVPIDMQTTVLAEFPPKQPPANLSVPGLMVEDVVSGRPRMPVVHRHDARQTAINFVFGMPELLGGGAGLPTLLEIAISRRPTVTLVALGAAEVLDAATAGDPARLPDPAAFGAMYRQVVGALAAARTAVIAATIPDPIDTAYFSSLDAASHVLKMPAPILASAYGLRPDDRLTPNGLIEIGCQMGARKMGPLPSGAVVPGQAVAAIRAAVAALNKEIAAAASEHGAVLFELDAVMRRIASEGLRAGSRNLTNEFLGGVYSLNGYTPGHTGQAAIANALIAVLNATYAANITPVDLTVIAESDPVADYRQPQGAEFSMEDLAAAAAQAAPAAQSPDDPQERSNRPAPRHAPRKAAKNPGAALPLRLPEGLEQELELVADASYFGDALRPVHTTDPEEAFYGLTGNLLFGGLALTDSRLHGTLRIKFSEPKDHVTHFEVTIGEGLRGEDGRLEAPQFYKLPNVMQQLLPPPGTTAISGDLDLSAGFVSNVKSAFMFQNSALFALVQVNPSFPKVPVQFPGEYGTATVKFEPRADGKLDFTFQGTTFVPLSIIGAPARFPLPFFTPQFDFASIPSNGTALHPHLRLSTRPVEDGAAADAPEIPAGTVREFVASAHNNSFGDDFSLNVPDLGGPAAGRSHLMGRVNIQFGPRFDGKVPFVVSVMPPGGQLADLPQSPFAQAFKHRIPDGLYGHNELLNFPKQTYHMDTISFLADPLDIAHGIVDLKTGRVIGDLLLRGMITTNWLLAMVMLEDRTPRATFQFRGPASFERGPGGQLVFRYNGALQIPFPEGFRFPRPDLQSTYSVGANSKLEPFLRLQAMSVEPEPGRSVSGGASHVKASCGDEFSYRYAVTDGSDRSTFEYTNHTHGGTFTMKALAWVGFLNSRSARAKAGEFDTVTFTGFGTWSGDASGASHVAAVQVCTSKSHPYVSVLIDAGMTSNVNTKPMDIEVTLP
ncbi:MAG TPA: hypothetical protein VK886_19715 [Vicinamibacterales bacterium]|nr:hypothetical protein [Vicinamibacterales bacterium]